jgi:hypothetical protein
MEFSQQFRNFSKRSGFLLHAPKAGTWTDYFTSPPKEGMLWIFPAGKIRRLRSRANPRSWVPEGSMLTTRTPKPLGIRSPDRPARSQSLYRLSHRAPKTAQCVTKIGHRNGLTPCHLLRARRPYPSSRLLTAVTFISHSEEDKLFYEIITGKLDLNPKIELLTNNTIRNILHSRPPPQKCTHSHNDIYQLKFH